jgi:transcriptional regulator with XRE-family HTH domain
MARPQTSTTALVPTWTGIHVRALREAKRMTVREFAAYVGVSERMVGKWEAGGAGAVPRPFNQQALDICLQRCGPDERGRFAIRQRSSPGAEGQRCLVIVQQCLQRPDMRQAVVERDIATVFCILNAHGMSQRQIAAMTGQSQSEISEILGGRRVVAYDVLARIADGLGIPRGHMGLAYDQSSAALIRRDAIHLWSPTPRTGVNPRGTVGRRRQESTWLQGTDVALAGGIRQSLPWDSSASGRRDRHAAE